MTDLAYQFLMELWREGGAELLARTPITVDWVPAREALILDLLRRGAAPEPGASTSITITPIWSEKAGQPTTIGFRAMASVGGVEASRIFSTSYFRAQSQQISARLVESGKLKEGEFFEFCVLAVPRESGPALQPRFRLTQQEMPLQIKPANSQRVMGGALLFGADHAKDLPIFFHWSVLEEASMLTRGAGAIETGGILVGHVCWDAQHAELFLEITALIPAEAKGELTKLSFTPDTWNDVQAKVDRRDQQEVWLGWMHSHSFYHHEGDKGEGQEKRQTATPFLSDDDRRLHRVCFPRAYSIALLVTDSPQSGLSWTTFGWRAGELVQRPFHVIHAPLPEGFNTYGEKDESKRQYIGQGTDPQTDRSR